MNGFINLYKPSGISSAHIINKIKKGLKGASIGHMGTLDPLASGVLPVAVGKSTRMFDYLLDKTKVYIAKIEFGYETDTLDLEGKVVKTSAFIPSEDEVREKSLSLVGEIYQLPPLFSAKCVNGKRSYELARKGKAVELQPKKVNILSVDVLGKTEGKAEYEIKISCKGGTYIRAIARDLGYACSSCATMTSLVRVSSGIFDIATSVTAEDFLNSEDKEKFIVPPDMVVDFPILSLDRTRAERLFNGLRDDFDQPDGLYRVYSPDGFYGIGVVEGRKLKVKAYLRDDKAN